MSNPVSDANNVMSDIHAENTTPVDQGKAVPKAEGTYKCTRVGELQFRFKGSHLLAWYSTVILKWRATGVNDEHQKIVGETGARTSQQVFNAALAKLMVGPFLGQKVLGPEAIKKNGEIELTVYSEQLFTLHVYPGVTVHWDFTVKDGGKVDFNVVHRVNLLKSLRYQEELMKAWSKEQNKNDAKKQTKNSELQQLSAKERERMQKHAQVCEAAKNEAKKKTEDLKRQLQAQAEIAHQKLTKLQQDQEEARLLNASKDEKIADLKQKVSSLEVLRAGYLKQVSNLSECVKTTQSEKDKVVHRLWEQRELVSQKDNEMAAQAQTLRALESKLQKYREDLASSREEVAKLSQEIAALREHIKEQEAKSQEETQNLADHRKKLQSTIETLNLALTKESNQNEALKVKLRESIQQQENMKITITEQEKQIDEITDKYQTARASLHETNATLDDTKVDLIHSNKALGLAKDEHARAKTESETRIADLESTIQALKKSTQQDLSTQTNLQQEVERQLQQERARCTKLGNANSSLRENVNDLRADLDKATKDYERVQANATQLEKDCHELRDNLQEVTAKAAQAAKLASAKQVEAQLTIATTVAQSKEDLEALKREHEAERKGLETTVEQLRSKAKSLAQETAKAKNVQVGVVEADELKNAYAKIAGIMEAADKKSEASIHKLQNAAEQQIAALRAQLSLAKRHAHSLSIQLDKVRGELQDTKVLNQTMELQNNATTVELKATKEAMASCKTQLMKSQAKEQMLLEQCREFEFATNRKSRHLASAKYIINDLNEQLQKCRRAHHGSTSTVATESARGRALSDAQLPSSSAPPASRPVENFAPPPPESIKSPQPTTPTSTTKQIPIATAVPLSPSTTSASSAPSAPAIPVTTASPVPVTNASPIPVATARGRAFGSVQMFSPQSSSRVFDCGDTFTPNSSRAFDSPDVFSPGAAPPGFIYSSQVQVLQQMGYGPNEHVLSLLVKFNGNLHRVVTELLK